MNLDWSKNIYQKAVKDINPYAVILMMSGGDDSLTTYHVAKALGIKFDAVMHGVTGTGLPATRLFVHQEVSRNGDKIIEANAEDAYEKYVLRKGFFGLGDTAHSYSYHTLKSGPFQKAISTHFRKGQRNRPIILLNGAR